MHESDPFVVVGILNPTNSVVDNLILSNVETIWAVHHQETETEEEVHGHVQDSIDTPSILIPGIVAGDSTKEITSMLIKYRSPMGALQLPRMVNSQSSMQAASPAFETARLFSILGVGVEVLMGFAYMLIFISGLSIFIALYNSLKERKYDLAIMRSMGASRLRLFTSIVLEGGILTLMGSIMGLLLGHGVLVLLSYLVADAKRTGFSGLTFYPQEWIILGASLLLGMICALLPAIQAYRTDISKVLAGN
jgi:putative ABC transport system permease protein